MIFFNHSFFLKYECYLMAFSKQILRFILLLKSLFYFLFFNLQGEGTEPLYCSLDLV